MSLTLLVVEDNHVSQVGLGLVLGRERDLRVVPADTVAAAGDMLDGGLRPDVAILDLDLPDKRGEELIPRFAAIGAPYPRILIVSGTPDLGRIERAVAACPGEARAIPKPYHLDELLAAIRGESRP